jgi:CRISPR-associated endonuclease/helicase Cas3
VPLRPLAHSAAKDGGSPQPYGDHVAEVVRGARSRAQTAAGFARDKAAGQTLVNAVSDAAIFHDLGKLDPANQAVLRGGRNKAMCWDHIDAGVAHLMACGAGSAAWAVRAHHAPGLPSKPEHFSRAGRNPDQVRLLRGRRNDDETAARHAEQIDRTDERLTAMLAIHEGELDRTDPTAGKTNHGFPLRLALSCLVDADHSDSATFDTGLLPAAPPAPRWRERLAALDAHVQRLQAEASARSEDRAAFYAACRHRAPDAAMTACEGPVGIGKTTAVTAYLLRRAIATGARRLFVVAPYTAILSQTAKALRDALVLADERHAPEAIVAEHHHRAEFDDIASRDLALNWTAPIVLTTAVQFFETLAANSPATLRKLHALPGSVVFLDEAHAVIPTHLWPQNWLWLKNLTEDWSCSFVFASGSLVRFWENPDIAGESGVRLPDIAPPELARKLNMAERGRVAYRTLERLDGPEGIAAAVLAAPGPRLVILNTVQSAAVVARHMCRAKYDVLHISTALCPADREAVLQRIKLRLQDKMDSDWTLVATSLLEAGVDLSFRSAFRERFSAASLIQVGGRANRHYERDEAAVVYDFCFDSSAFLKRHPAAAIPGEVLHDLFVEGRFDGVLDPAALVTMAMHRELKGGAGNLGKNLLDAEIASDYPAVAKLGKVIDSDTRLVIVDAELRDRLAAFDPVKSSELLSHSVQIWRTALPDFGLEEIRGRPGIYWWPHPYDGHFLGYMQGALPLRTGEAFFL